jgi:hypothetical protein
VEVVTFGYSERELATSMRPPDDCRRSGRTLTTDYDAAGRQSSNSGPWSASSTSPKDATTLAAAPRDHVPGRRRNRTPAALSSTTGSCACIRYPVSSARSSTTARTSNVRRRQPTVPSTVTTRTYSSRASSRTLRPPNRRHDPRPPLRIGRGGLVDYVTSPSAAKDWNNHTMNCIDSHGEQLLRSAESQSSNTINRTNHL